MSQPLSHNHHYHQPPGGRSSLSLAHDSPSPSPSPPPPLSAPSPSTSPSTSPSPPPRSSLSSARKNVSHIVFGDDGGPSFDSVAVARASSASVPKTSSPLRGKAVAPPSLSLNGIFSADPAPATPRPSRRPGPPSLMTATIQHFPVQSAVAGADGISGSISGSTRRRLDSPLSRSSLSLGYEELPARPEASLAARRSSPSPPPESFATPAGRRTIVAPYNILSPPPPEPIPSRPASAAARYSSNRSTFQISPSDSANVTNATIAYEGAPAVTPKPRPLSAYANKSSVVFGEIDSTGASGIPVAVHRPARRVGKWTNFSSIVMGSDSNSNTSNTRAAPVSQSATTLVDSEQPAPIAAAAAVAAPSTPNKRFSGEFNKSSIVFGDDGGPSIHASSKLPVSRKKAVVTAIATDRHETLAEFIGHAKTVMTDAASRIIPKKDPAAIPHSAGVVSGKFKVY
ncbi:hypothetical protein HDU83_007294 [Entophlyctis luteolus]|nr:hypothetical protein HDU83_007294 [Entophlyctis luteolus]